MKNIRKVLLAILAICITVPCVMGVTIGGKKNGETNGVLTEPMQIVLREADDDEKIRTIVWFVEPDIDYVQEQVLSKLGYTLDTWEEYLDGDKTENDIVQTYISEKRALSRAAYNEYNKKLVNEYLKDQEVEFVSEYSSLVIAQMVKDDIIALSENKAVAEIDFYAYGFTPEVDLSAEITRNDMVHGGVGLTYHYDGSGVKVGVLDAGYPDTSLFPDVTAICLDETYTPSLHATSILDIFSTYAKGAVYIFSNVNANTSSYSNLFRNIEEMLSLGINILNISGDLHNLNLYENGNTYLNYYGTVSKWLDHIIYKHDVHVVKSAGNVGESGISTGGMGYNVITVGNLNCNGTLSKFDDMIYTGSSYYNGYTFANKPDIVAPGTNLIFNNNQVQTGTSFSAAQVSAQLAILCEQRNGLKTQQDVAKAILAAGVDTEAGIGYETSNPAYRYYGAGLLDCVNSCYIVGNYHYLNTSIASGTASKSHTVTVSGESIIRFALSYVMKSTHSTEDISIVTAGPLPNLDLYVYDSSGNLVACATNINNSMEVLDVYFSTGGTYTVRVVQTTSAGYRVYYGLAWNQRF